MTYGELLFTLNFFEFLSCPNFPENPSAVRKKGKVKTYNSEIEFLTQKTTTRGMSKLLIGVFVSENKRIRISKTCNLKGCREKSEPRVFESCSRADEEIVGEATERI